MVSARKKGISLLVTGGVLVGIIIIAQRFGIGGKIVEGVGGLGGLLTSAPLEFLKQFALGAGKIGEEAVKVSENFQRSLSGGLLASEQELFGGGGFVGGTITPESVIGIPGAGETIGSFFQAAINAFQPGARDPNITARAEERGQVFDIGDLFTPTGTTRRISERLPTFTTNIFGQRVEISASEQDRIQREAQLQLEIAKQRALTPEFFSGFPPTTSGGFVQQVDSQGRPIRSL